MIIGYSIIKEVIYDSTTKNIIFKMEQGKTISTPLSATMEIDSLSVQTVDDKPMVVNGTAPSNNPSGITRLNQDGSINHELVSNEEKERLSKLTTNLSPQDLNSVANFGAELGNSLNRHSNAFLSAVRVRNAGDELGSLILSLRDNLDEVDVDELTPASGFKRFISKIPVINKLFSSVSKVLKKYDTIEKSVDSIARDIEVARLASLKDNNALQKMFQDNNAHQKQIEELIIAAKLKYEETVVKLDEMRANPQKYETYEISDYQEFLNNLEHRISDLTVLHCCLKQTLPQIRLIQNNNLATANKAQSMISITIPLWRTQLSEAVALKRQEGRAKALKLINDTTNELLKRNADLLRQNSVQIAKENERGIVEIETLRHTSQQLIDTINEVRDIHANAVRQRKEMEAEIVKIETTIESALTSQVNDSGYYYR